MDCNDRDVQLRKARHLLRQESENRAVEDDGVTLFQCLAISIRNHLPRIPNVCKHTATFRKYTNGKLIEKGVVDLLARYEKKFKSILLLLADDELLSDLPKVFWTKFIR